MKAVRIRNSVLTTEYRKNGLDGFRYDLKLGCDTKCPGNKMKLLIFKLSGRGRGRAMVANRPNFIKTCIVCIYEPRVTGRFSHKYAE